MSDIVTTEATGETAHMVDIGGHKHALSTINQKHLPVDFVIVFTPPANCKQSNNSQTVLDWLSRAIPGAMLSLN